MGLELEERRKERKNGGKFQKMPLERGREKGMVNLSVLPFYLSLDREYIGRKEIDAIFTPSIVHLTSSTLFHHFKVGKGKYRIVHLISLIEITRMKRKREGRNSE